MERTPQLCMGTKKPPTQSNFGLMHTWYKMPPKLDFQLKLGDSTTDRSILNSAQRASSCPKWTGPLTCDCASYQKDKENGLMLCKGSQEAWMLPCAHAWLHSLAVGLIENVPHRAAMGKGAAGLHYVNGGSKLGYYREIRIHTSGISFSNVHENI